MKYSQLKRFQSLVIQMHHLLREIDCCSVPYIDWEKIELDEISLWGTVACKLKEENKTHLIQECLDKVSSVHSAREKLSIIEQYCDIDLNIHVYREELEPCDCDDCKQERGETIQCNK